MKRLLPLLALALFAPALPAAAQITIAGSTVLERAARPGETYTGTLVVRNLGAETEEVRLYAADYTFSADGRSDYGEPGKLARSSARWLAFSPAELRIAPGGEATVGYTVTVPAGAQLSGSYWSMLMVEGTGPAPAASAQAGARVQVGIRPRIRHGVQIATHIAGTGTHAAHFDGVRATGGARGKALELDLANDGEVAYRPELRLELYDAAGNPVASLTSQRGLLYPGTSLRQRFELGALPAGTYQALVVADTGGAEMFGAQYRLEL